MKKRRKKSMQTLTVKDRESKLMDAIRDLGPGWHDRNELADKLGKARLNPADIVTLDMMVERGLLDKGLAQTEMLNVSRWQYRAKESK